MNWATIIVLLVVLALVVLAVRTLRKGKRSCSCGCNSCNAKCPLKDR